MEMARKAVGGTWVENTELVVFKISYGLRRPLTVLISPKTLEFHIRGYKNTDRYYLLIQLKKKHNKLYAVGEPTPYRFDVFQIALEFLEDIDTFRYRTEYKFKYLKGCMYYYTRERRLLQKELRTFVIDLLNDQEFLMAMRLSLIS